MRFPDNIVYRDNNRYNTSDGFIAKLGYDCRCTGPAVASYKDSLINERTVRFSYTGSTEAIDSVVWTYGYGQRRRLTSGFGTPFTHTYASGQAYRQDTICVTVYSGCGIERSCRYPNPLPGVGVPAAPASSSIRLYPNPARDGRFTLELPGGATESGPVLIRVVSASGQIVYEGREPVTGAAFRKDLDLHGAAPGVYLVSIESAVGRQTLRLALQ